MRKVVAIIHTYAQDRELGSYMQELVNAFMVYDIKLYLIVTNDLVDSLNERSIGKNISEEKYIKYIKNINPDFVFSTNRGGITKKLMRSIECPIITWMVDRIPFLHHGGSHSDLFCDRDYVITSSFKNVARLEQIYPKIKGRVHFLPFATSMRNFSIAQSKDVNISFVGTYFCCGQFTKILEDYQDAPVTMKSIFGLLGAVEHDYDLDFPRVLDQFNLRRLLKEYDLDIYKFKGLLANAISLNDRVRHLDAVSDLGLELYGTRNWIGVNQYSTKLLRCYHFGEFIKTRKHLCDLYQRSKISINIPHIQAGDGLPYRVFDIMASDSLLISKFRKDSDLFRLFGEDMPIPMYRSENDLRRLCKYYLENENERKEIIRRSNALVEQGFSFEGRVRSFFEIIGISVELGNGSLIRVSASEFKIATNIELKSVDRIRIKRLLKRILPIFVIRIYRRVVRRGITIPD